MKKLKPWLLIILVFAAGFVGGVVVTRAKVRHFLQESFNHPESVRDMMEQRMVRRLDLDAGQRDKVHRILVDRQEQMSDLRHEFAPRFFQVVTEAESEISTLLTPEQRKKFERLREENLQRLTSLRR